MRTSRRLKAWEQAGLIRRNAEAITVTGSVTPTVTEDTAAVTEAADVTRMSGAERARLSTTPVRLAAFVVALALACVSAAFSIDGLTAIFAGAFWPIIIMGAVLEAGNQVAAAWLTEHWNSAPSLLRLILVLMIGVLMGLNAIGVFGLPDRPGGVDRDQREPTPSGRRSALSLKPTCKSRPLSPGARLPCRQSRLRPGRRSRHFLWR
jgi:hypothetical protein